MNKEKKAAIYFRAIRRDAMESDKAAVRNALGLTADELGKYYNDPKRLAARFQAANPNAGKTKIEQHLQKLVGPEDKSWARQIKRWREHPDWSFQVELEREFLAFCEGEEAGSSESLKTKL